MARLDQRDAILDVRAEEADLAESRAKTLQAKAAGSSAEAKLRECKAQVDSNMSQLEKAQLDQDRAKQLFDGASKAISKQEFDATTANLEISTGALGAAKAAEEAATAVVEAAKAALGASKSREVGNQVALENAKLLLSFTEIIAAESGRIAKKHLETGQRVEPSQSIMAIVSNKRWIIANLKENQMGKFIRGNAPKFGSMLYRAKLWKGQ